MFATLGAFVFAAGVALFLAAILLCRHPHAPRWVHGSALQSTTVVVVIALLMLGGGLLLKLALDGVLLANGPDALGAAAVLLATALGIWLVHPARRLQAYGQGRLQDAPMPPAGPTAEA